MAFKQSGSGIFKGMNSRVTIWATGLIVSFLAVGSLFTAQLAQTLDEARGVLDPFLEWYYVFVFAFLLFYMIWLGIGRYKNVRLGRNDEQPEFTFFSWIAMLFAAGTGVGILFWAVAQPILQFENNPFVSDDLSPEAARVAMSLTYFHWGLNGWAIFAFVALTLAFFAYRRSQPLTIRSGLIPLLGCRTRGWMGDAVDVLATFATVFGIATTLGLGVQQMNAGLSEVFGFEQTVAIQSAVAVVIMGIATVSVVSGLQRGVRALSRLNFWLSIAIALAVLFFGPTQYLFAITLESTGHYVQNLLQLTLYTHASYDSDWQSEWTVFFWGWWLAWSPFVGMFIARISRGRTFREFVMGVLLVPTAITIVWIGLFGGTALYQELFGNGGIIAAVNADEARALFVTMKTLAPDPVGLVISAALIVLIATYLITSANAGTLVINTILSGGYDDPPTLHRILWGIILTLMTVVLLMAGGLEALQSAVIMAALPFSVIILAMAVGLTRALRNENYAARQGDRAEPPREPWPEVDDAGSRGTEVTEDQKHKEKA
ncbi:choline/glycine/proline betaine transport protein [Halopseudomonas xinjiangensis]|uniref:Choline/glycine/proline betaine transport protein n=1 Tax=Halopseudomonas xinjiangensis TaxID=487184 RepID=A0A1H1SZ95_9GAMM|nr:BCCT family transporter [Halopseudomonas xinjiangensis]SDS53251.1 choline/glycine/proline betaine transport protein [Halopseudomonas xinjiangensis]